MRTPDSIYIGGVEYPNICIPNLETGKIVHASDVFPDYGDNTIELINLKEEPTNAE